MTITRNRNGSLTISDIVGTQYIHRTYYGYTRREAISLFRAYRRECKFA